MEAAKKYPTLSEANSLEALTEALGLIETPRMLELRKNVVEGLKFDTDIVQDIREYEDLLKTQFKAKEQFRKNYIIQSINNKLILIVKGTPADESYKLEAEKEQNRQEIIKNAKGDISLTLMKALIFYEADEQGSFKKEFYDEMDSAQDYVCGISQSYPQEFQGLSSTITKIEKILMQKWKPKDIA